MAVFACLLSLQACGFFRSPEENRILSLSPAENFDETHRLVMKGRYEVATRRLRQIVENTSPRNGYRDAAMFWLGFCCRETGDPYGSRTWYRRLIAEFPDSSYVPLAKERLRLLSTSP